MNSFRSIIILILIFVTHNLIYTQTVRLDPTRTYYWYYDNSLPTNGIRDGNLNPLSQSDQQTFVRNTIESVLYSICKYSERDPIFHFEETTNINSADLIITFATKIELAGCNQNSLVPNTIIFSNDPHQQFAPPGQYYWTNTITTWDPRGVRGTNKYNPFFKCLLLHEVVAHVFAIGHSTTGNESDVTREDPTAYSPSGDEQIKLKDNYNPKFDLAIRNYFSGGMAVDAAGLVTIDKSTSAVYDESIPSGGKIVTFAEEELNILLSAKRQQADGHWQTLNYYQGSVGRQSYQSWELYETENGNLDIHYKRECNLTYRLYYNNAVQSGTMMFNGSTENVTVVKQVEQDANIQVSVPMVTVNNINYYFEKWNEDNNTDNPRTFAATQTTTYTAKLLGYAYTPNVHFDGAMGQPIVVDWDDHPNTSVTQYKVWRKDPNHPDGILLATLNRGTTSYTDNDYTIYDNNGDYDKIYYAVNSYFLTDGTWSVNNWRSILGEEGLQKINIQNDVAMLNSNKIAEEIPNEYMIDNYPNPFNPATTIKYQLPKAGIVTIKVYDILGKEAATLVNEIKPAGYYSVNFDGRELTSGIYIATIQVNNFIQSKKMLLVK